MIFIFLLTLFSHLETLQVLLTNYSIKTTIIKSFKGAADQMILKWFPKLIYAYCLVLSLDNLFCVKDVELLKNIGSERELYWKTT